jgi:hypothetical protein
MPSTNPDETRYKRSYNLFVYNPATRRIRKCSPRNAPSSIQRSASFNVNTDMQLGVHYNNLFGKHSVKSFLIFEEAHSSWDSFTAYRELLVDSEFLFAGEALNQVRNGRYSLAIAPASRLLGRQLMITAGNTSSI